MPSPCTGNVGRIQLYAEAGFIKIHFDSGLLFFLSPTRLIGFIHGACRLFSVISRFFFTILTLTFPQQYVKRSTRHFFFIGRFVMHSTKEILEIKCSEECLAIDMCPVDTANKGFHCIRKKRKRVKRVQKNRFQSNRLAVGIKSAGDSFPKKAQIYQNIN